MDGRMPGMEASLTPEPDHLKGLTIQPAECAAFEDALAGVAAGPASDFEPRVGRAGQAQVLRAHGADVVDLTELLAET